MEIAVIIFIVLTFICLTLAFYFYVSRDLEKYQRRVEERLQRLIDERGAATVSKRDIQEIKQELLSEAPKIHQLLLRFEIFSELQAILRQADFTRITVYRFVVISLISGFVVGTIPGLYARSLFVMFVTTVMVSLFPLFFVLSRRRKRFKLLLNNYPMRLK